MTTTNAGLRAASLRASASIVTGEFWAPMHGLRGVAVLYVLASHLGNLGLPLIPVPHDRIGKVGVWIFFGLSAFLLTSRLRAELLDSRHRLHNIAAYFIHRFFRIYPLFCVVLLIHVAVRDFPMSEAADHLLLRAGHEELWAIPVEFKYYFVIPCVALASLLERKPRFLVLLLLAALLVGLGYGVKAPARVFSNELGVLPKAAPFLLGSLLALLFDPALRSSAGGPHRWRLLSLASLIGLLAGTVAFHELEASRLPLKLAPWVSLAIGLSVMGLMRCAFAEGALSRVLRSTALVFLGEISFSVYLLHLFVIQRVVALGGLPSPAATAWLSVVAVLGCAIVSYTLIERPGMRLGKVLGRALPID